VKHIAIFPGSFDPFTKGHHDIVIRGLSVFDEIIIAIGKNTIKERYFNLEEMITKIKQSLVDYKNVSVESYEGLTAEFARECGAKFILRGLRNTTDFEYENAIAYGNKSINQDLETIFLITSPPLTSISSSIIREIHKFGGNVDEFLPYKLGRMAHSA